MTPRLLTIMGSGETAPTMVKVHRAVMARLRAEEGAVEPRGLLLDTPFGFQTNAGEIAARAVEYFRDSVGAELEIAGLRGVDDLAGPGGDVVVAKIAAAPLIFAGPGSPTYALRQWHDTLVPKLLAEKLTFGGAVTFASAAALTLGALSVPVYEIYKVGESARWVDGLDLLAALGIPAVVIPHYDNAEGGTHDTRFCYLGEQRLAAMEEELPDGTFVLGVDEHTALSLDLGAGSAEVVGHGAVTVRARGRSQVIEPGSAVAIDELVATAGALAAGDAGPARAPTTPTVASQEVRTPTPPRLPPGRRPSCAPSTRRRTPSVSRARPATPGGWWERSSHWSPRCGRGGRTRCSPTTWTEAAPRCGPW